MAGRIRGLLAALLAIMMALGLAPGAALAEEVGLEPQAGGKDVPCLGTGGIAVPSGGWNTTDGSYVYYGKYDGTNPTKYRVLANGTTDFTDAETPTMLLDCDTVLATTAYGETRAWGTSSAKAWATGEAFLTKGGNFTDPEKVAIARSVTTTGEVPTATDKLGADFKLTGEQAFVLSKGEVATYYKDEDAARVKKLGEDSGIWWLRTAGTSTDDPCAAIVVFDGSVNSDGYPVDSDSIGVSPAFNINLKSVIFSSLISGSDYKLTIKDPDLAAFGSATLDGTKATVTYATDGDAGQASYLVTDKAWDDGWPADAKVLAYGRLGDPGEQKGAFELPDGCAADGWGTDYHVYVLAENVSEGSATDYASKPEKIKKVTPEPTPAPDPEPEPQPADVPPVSVTAHVQRKGTLAAVSGGAVAGTTGKSLRMESIRLTVDGASAAGGIEYRSHVQRKGWEKAFVRDGKLSGTEGKSRRMEAVQIRLWGDMAAKYDVYYRVHVQKYGWMAWAKNGQSAGTQGMSRRVEAIQVVLVAKDGPAPAKALKGATQQYAKAFVKK